MASDTASAGRPSVTTIALAALTAVAFWSLKPIFISVIGDRGGYAEVYVAAATISILTSTVCCPFLWRRLLMVSRGGRRSLYGFFWAGASGFFLALWYYGFYRSLYGAAKPDATIIAFTWPLISVIAIRIFSPSTADKLKWHQWLLILASFAGAAAIGVSNIGAAGTPPGSSPEIIWAFVAAIGSGLYLPFAINATNAFERSAGSRPISTFFAISVANVVALFSVLIALTATDYKLRFNAFDQKVMVVCALIGIGTYLVAEVTWTWAFREYRSLTLSSLPYFSPAVSVILLHVIFDEPVRPIAILGLVVILFSNLTLHARHRSANAFSLTLVATVYVALASQILPTNIDGPVPEMAAAMTGMFAILAGFILSRAAARRTQELDARAILVRRLVGTDRTDGRSHADRMLRELLELEFETSVMRREERYLAIREMLSAQPGDTEEVRRARDDAVEAFTSWQAIHMDRISIGEWAALWLTGLGSILFVLLLRGTSAFGNIGAIVFAAGALLAIFTIYDYDRNSVHGFRNQLWRLEQGFREIGMPYYVPARLLDSGEFASTRIGGTVRTSHADGEPREVETPTGISTFNAFYLGTAVLAIAAVALLPFTSIGQLGPATATPRPGLIQWPAAVDDRLPSEQITIANPGWPAAEVIAEILNDVLVSSGQQVRIEKIDHSTAIRDLPATEARSIDIHPDLWLQNQGPSFQDSVADGLVQLNARPYVGRQGIYVLDADQSEKALVKWSDLEDPAVAARFDSDGDGKAEMWVGPRGWASTDILLDWISRNPNLLVEGETYSETIFKAVLSDNVRRGADRRPLLFYSYQPDWIHEEYLPRELTSAPFERADCESSFGSSCGVNVDVYVAWSSALSPDVAAVLRRVYFDLHDVNSFIEGVARDEKSPAEVADQWITTHPKTVAGWRR